LEDGPIKLENNLFSNYKKQSSFNKKIHSKDQELTSSPVKEADSKLEASKQSEESYEPSTDSIDMIRAEFKNAIKDLEERMIQAGQFASLSA
jgi:hypothetical protein